MISPTAVKVLAQKLYRSFRACDSWDVIRNLGAGMILVYYIAYTQFQLSLLKFCTSEVGLPELG
jgi:hypothetical protein